MSVKVSPLCNSTRLWSLQQESHSIRPGYESLKRCYSVATPRMLQGILLQPHPLGDLPSPCLEESVEVTCEAKPLIGADQHLLRVGQTSWFVCRSSREGTSCRTHHEPCVQTVESDIIPGFFFSPDSLSPCRLEQVAVGGVGAACRWVTSTVRSPTFVNEALDLETLETSIKCSQVLHIELGPSAGCLG